MKSSEMPWRVDQFLSLSVADLLLQSVVLLQVQEVSDVRVPWLQVDGEGSWTLGEGGKRETGGEREGEESYSSMRVHIHSHTHPHTCTHREAAARG